MANIKGVIQLPENDNRNAPISPFKNGNCPFLNKDHNCEIAIDYPGKCTPKLLKEDPVDRWWFCSRNIPSCSLYSSLIKGGSNEYC